MRYDIQTEILYLIQSPNLTKRPKDSYMTLCVTIRTTKCLMSCQKAYENLLSHQNLKLALPYC